MDSQNGPVGLKPLPRGKGLAKQKASAPQLATSVASSNAPQPQERDEMQTQTAPVNGAPANGAPASDANGMPGVMGGANGMLGPVGGNMAQMMASMMGGSSGGGGDGGGGHANGMPGPMGGNMAQVMASMMSGGGGGMDPAMLHGFMEAQRQRLAQSPIARQAMANPGMMAEVLQSNPAARAIMEANPRLHQLMTSPNALQGILQGNLEHYRGVLGENVEEHLATVSHLNAYSQQLRRERGGGGAAAADESRTGSAQPSGHSPPSGLHQPAGPPDAGAGGAAGGSGFPAAAAGFHSAEGLAAAGARFPPAAARQAAHTQHVSAEIQPAPGGQELPVSWTPHTPQAGGRHAAHLGTGSRWASGMDQQHSPHTHGPGCQHSGALGGPQAKPLLPHADAIFPAAFCLAVGALCQANWLPFWLLLAAILPTFIAGLHFIVFKAGGVEPRRLPATRFTMALVATLEGLSFAAFARTVLPALHQHRVGCVAAVALGSVAYVQHYRAARKAPDYVTAPTDPEVAAAKSPRFNMGMCDTCRVARPLRSKHCDHCGRCVMGADHHCPVVNACVGQGNVRLFLVYIMTLLAAQVLFLRLVAEFCRHAAHQPGAAFLPALWRASAWHPGLVLLAYVQVPCATANAFLVARALLCIAANLTTNELMRPTRFGYLAENFSGSGAGSGGAFLNPFDHGPAANCVQFWRAPHAPDWGHVYQQHAEASLEAAARRVPRWSITAAVRSFQLAARHMTEARARRRREREDYVLLTYGGVKAETLVATRDAPEAAGSSGCGHHHVLGTGH